MNDPILGFLILGCRTDYYSSQANSNAKIKHAPLTTREMGHPCSQKLSMISLELHHDSARAKQEMLGHVCVCVGWGGYKERTVLGICG